ncbi:hypothetical protein SLEP1_g9840 [Rubroshorea leprosula]|uniref:Uncharacterized protein n=1 Tax=Rubroshorea leprosula TaxID=152421 RepID=A0AAV5IFG6_9ROSI|nr:hypothetical protein SLEP1_g9840 [Rubroshorea leprosula]
MKVSVYLDQLKGKIMDTRVKAALDVCATVIDDALDRLNESVSTMEVGKGGEATIDVEDRRFEDMAQRFHYRSRNLL